MQNRIVFSMVVVLAVLGLCMPATAKDFLYVPGANHVSVVDCTTDTVVKTIDIKDYVIGCAPSFDNKRFYVNGWRNIYVIDTTTDQVIDKLTFWTDLNRVNIFGNPSPSLDGNSLYMIWMTAQKKLNVPRLTVPPWKFVIFDLKKKQVTKSYDVPFNTTAIVPLTGDPDNVILMSQDILKMNLKDGKMTKIKGQLHPEEGQPMLNNLILWVNWSPTGDSGIFPSPAYGSDGSLTYLLLNRKDGSLKEVKGEEVPFYYSNILSPDGKFLYGVMDEVYKIDLATGKTMAMDILERGTTYAMAISSDGKKLYLGPAGPDVAVYDTATMKRIGLIPLKHDGIVMSRLNK
ncbi:MAG: hypothetical protein AB1640_00445 [bacterium]